jgi:hypothetical protein
MTATASTNTSTATISYPHLNGVIQQRIAIAVQHAREGNSVEIRIEPENETFYLCWRNARGLRHVISASSISRKQMETLLPAVQHEFTRRLLEAEGAHEVAHRKESVAAA